MAEEKDMNMEEEIPVVVIEDAEGHEKYYEEETVIPYNGKEFAILVAIPTEECEEGCKCHEEPDAIIARIDTDENGEAVYVAPEEEEFEAVLKLYDELEDEE